MKTIHIINGPNLNNLGLREPEIYGTTLFEDYLERLRDSYSSVEIVYFQSNHEGELIDYIQDIQLSSDGVVINAGALSHYSYALLDAIRASSIPVVEVHISNVFGREEYRSTSVLAPACAGFISGFGLDGYRLAIAHLVARRKSYI